MKNQAQGLYYQIESQFQSRHQKANFKSMMNLFLKGDGQSQPEHSELKSASSLSRFLNIYVWELKALIRVMRKEVLRQLSMLESKKKRELNIIIDLTSLEKAGEFKHLPIAELKGVKGLHLVLLFVQCGELGIPWGFRIWRGKGSASSADLAWTLIKSLPSSLKERFKLRILADAGFSSAKFLEKLESEGLDAVVGMRSDRCLEDNKKLHSLKKQARKVKLRGLSVPVWVAWFWVKRKKQRLRYFVISLTQASAKEIKHRGRFRWRIEAFFKTMKQRFGLARFGQSTKQGVFRYLSLSLLAYLLSHLEALVNPHLSKKNWPNWRALALKLRSSLFPQSLRSVLLNQLELLDNLILQQENYNASN